MIYWIAGIGLLFGIRMTEDISMALYIAAIGLTFGLFIVFVLHVVYGIDDDETDDGLK